MEVINANTIPSVAKPKDRRYLELSKPLGEEKHFLSLPGIQPQLLSRPSCSPIIIPTELSRPHHCVAFPLVKTSCRRT